MRKRHERPRDRLEEAAGAVVALAYLVVMLWMLVPQHRRRLLALQVLRALETTSDRLARMAGRAAMRRELAGDAYPGYELPEALGRLRDFVGRLYGVLRSR